MKVTEYTDYVVIEAEGTNNVVTDENIAGKKLMIPNSLNIDVNDFREIPSANLLTEELLNSDDYAEDGMWDILQDKGDRVDYSYAFNRWKQAERIIPKYPLRNIDKISYALLDCESLIDARNLIFRITSENPVMLYTCGNCKSMTYAPYFIFENADFIKNYTSMYSGCEALKEAEVFWGNYDNSTNYVANRNNCSNMFFNCYELKNIKFLGKGSPKNLDLSASEKITMETLNSLAESLVPFTSEMIETLGGKPSIQLSEKVVKRMSGYAQTEINTHYSQISFNDTPVEILKQIPCKEFLNTVNFDLKMLNPPDDVSNYVLTCECGNESEIHIGVSNCSFSLNLSNESSADLLEGIKLTMSNTGVTNKTFEISNVYYTYRQSVKNAFISKNWDILPLLSSSQELR